MRASVGVVMFFRRDLLRRWRLLLGALGCSVAYSAVRLAEPWPLKVIFDNVLAERPLHTPFAAVDGLLAGDHTRILAAAALAILCAGSSTPGRRSSRHGSGRRSSCG